MKRFTFAMRRQRDRPHRSQGFALIIALVLLVAISLIGVTTIRTALIEQKLATASLDRNIALQAAETALRLGEARALNHAKQAPLERALRGDGVCDVSTRSSSCNDGICILHDPDCPPRGQDPSFTAWAIANDAALGTLAGAKPTYVIEYLGADFECHTPDPTRPSDPNNKCKRYRITARSSPAGNDRATVILETIYATE